jgi:hypothetical protein
VANEALGVIGPYSPLGRQIDVRPWTDLNGDGNVINGDLTPQYDEIGPSDNPNFGRPTIARQWGPDHGAGQKLFNKSAITTSNEAFGGNGVVSAVYRRPQAVQAGRLLTFGMQMFF